MDQQQHTITEADAELIAEKLREQMAKELKLEVGGAVIKWARKFMWTLMLMLFAYGWGTGKIPAALLDR